MAKSSFRVSTKHSGRLRQVRVTVYDDIDELRRDASSGRWRSLKDAGDTPVDTLGVCHRTEWQSDGKSLPLCAHIRLHKDHMGVGIVTHEIAHAALFMYELDNPERLTTEDIEHEEVFCHILGDLTSRVVSKLYAKGYYTT